MARKIEQWQKQFATLWSGQAISVLTSSIVQMAIIWYLTDTTRSAAVLSIASIVGFVPQAVIGTFAGVYIDRHNRKKIMIISDSLIALLCLSLSISGLFGEIPIWLIMVVLFLRSVCSAFHSPSLHAVTPLIVPKKNLTKYAGYTQGFESISHLLSPAIAAFLYAVWDLQFIILLDVFGAIFAIIMLGFVSIPDIRENNKETPHFFIELKKGFRLIRQTSGMVVMLVVCSLYAMVYFPIGTYYPLITMSHFEKGVDGSAVVEVIFFVGSLVGSFLLGLVGNKINRSASIGVSIGIYGLSIFVIGLLPAQGYMVFVALSFIMGITIPFFTGVRTAILQTKFEPQYLGRILSLVSSISLMAMPLGLILSGTFAEVIGVNRWFFLSGIAAILLASFALLSPSFRRCSD